MAVENAAGSAMRDAIDQGRHTVEKVGHAAKGGYDAAQDYIKDKGFNLDLGGLCPARAVVSSGGGVCDRLCRRAPHTPCFLTPRAPVIRRCSPRTSGAGADGIWTSSSGTNRSPLSPSQSLLDSSLAEERTPVPAAPRLPWLAGSPFVGRSATCWPEF